MYSTNLLTLLAIAAGTDYAIFLIGRFHEARHDGESREQAFLHRLPRHRPRGAGVGLDHHRRGVLPELHPAAVLQEPRCTCSDRHRRRTGGCPDAGAGDHDTGKSFRGLRPASADEDRGWRRIGTAVVRWPGPVLAGVHRSRVDRPGRPAGVQNQLRHPPVSASGLAGECRIRRRRTALLGGPAQPPNC